MLLRSYDPGTRCRFEHDYPLLGALYEAILKLAGEQASLSVKERRMCGIKYLPDYRAKKRQKHCPYGCVEISQAKQEEIQNQAQENGRGEAAFFKMQQGVKEPLLCIEKPGGKAHAAVWVQEASENRVQQKANRCKKKSQEEEPPETRPQDGLLQNLE